MNQAFNQAEQLSEQQALALAQERSNGNGHSNGKRHQSLDGAMNRLSVGSDSSSIQGSLTRMATNASTSSLISGMPNNNTLFTFTAGFYQLILVLILLPIFGNCSNKAPLVFLSIISFLIPKYQLSVLMT